MRAADANLNLQQQQQQQHHLHTSLELFTRETRLRSEWVLTSSTHSGSCTWYELSQAAWRPYMRTLHWKSSVIQFLTTTQILIFTETVPVLPLGGNYFRNNEHYNYFVPIIRILWKRPQLHVRSITVSHNNSSKHNFQTDSVKIIYE